MRDAPALSLRRRIVHLAGSGTIGTLVLLLIALWVMFAIAIGDRFFCWPCYPAASTFPSSRPPIYPD